MAKAPLKNQRKHIKVLNYALEKERVAKSQYNKFQRLVAKLIRVKLADKQQYLFQIHYKGNVKLAHGDVIANKQGVIFGVIQGNNNREARIVTLDGFVQKPNMNGTFLFIDKGDRKQKIEPIK